MRVPVLTLSLATGAIFLAAPGPAHRAMAQYEVEKLTADDARSTDYFGTSVGLSGDYCVVGAYLADGRMWATGVAYIFAWDGLNWGQMARIEASDGRSFDNFGIFASISGDYALIAAPDHNENAGAAYVFARDSGAWVEQAKLTANDAAPDDHFSHGVCVSGDFAIIGSPHDDDVGSGSGSVYIFHREGTNWIEGPKLIGSEAEAFDLFGWAVSLDGDYLLVGAHGDDDFGPDTGAVYFFRHAGGHWNEEVKLVASDPAPFDEFGVSVVIAGDYAAVGAPHKDDAGSSSGAVYVFKREPTGWQEKVKLTASDAAAGDFFGGSISMIGDLLVVGAQRNDDACIDDPHCESGSAYVFRRKGERWIQTAKLAASDAAKADQFGVSVGVNCNFAIIGAYFDDDACGGEPSCNSGSAYVYSIDPPCDMIPTVSAWGLSVLGLLLMAAATLLIRRSHLREMDTG